MSDKFENTFGKLPLFAGVYTNKSVNEMVEETKILVDKGFFVYLENIESLNNPSKIDSELKIIDSVLKNVPNSLLSKMGVNILPNRNGTEYLDSYARAQEFDLPFIVIDMIAGKYKIDSDTMNLDLGGYFSKKLANPNVFVIGGIFPPYATFVGRDKEFVIDMADAISDALMAKAQPDELQVPIDRVAYYKRDRKPVIPASKITENNISHYLGYASGFIIGSALRNKDSTLNISTIEKIAKTASDYRSSNKFF